MHSARERHRSDRAGWLRAAVLGANDAIVSTASVMIGVAGSTTSHDAILTAGVAGLVAGAMSMAVGEFVSVGSQRDTEQADISLERAELAADPAAETDELAGIYVRRGLDPALALQVAQQLMRHDALTAHMRDELGIDHTTLARPLQAAWISALSFAVFAAVPVLALLLAPATLREASIVVVSLGALAVLGAVGAGLGGAPRGRAAARVVVGGGIAMGVAAGIGHLLGVVVG